MAAALYTGLRYVPAVLSLRDGHERLVAAARVLRHLAAAPDVSAARASGNRVEVLLDDAEQDFGPRSAVLAHGLLAAAAGHLPWLGSEVGAARDLRRLGAQGVDLARLALPVAEDLAPSPGSGGALERLVAASRSQAQRLLAASVVVRSTERVLADLRSDPAPGPLAGPRRSALATGARYLHDAQVGLQLLRLLPEAAGPTPRRYLLLLTNPSEERPGGGFIGEVGDVVVRDGRVVSEEFRSGYFADRMKLGVPAPAALRRYLIGDTPFSLADDNWSPDFPTSASAVADFYRRATGRAVDAVIATDPVALGGVLKVLGGVSVPPYPGVVTARDTLRHLDLLVDGPPGQAVGKQYLAAFGHAFLHRALDAPGSRAPGLLSAARQAVRGKHLVVWSRDIPGLGPLLHGQHADGSVTAPGGEDRVMVVDANLSGAKSDLFVRRSFSLTVSGSVRGYTQHHLVLDYRWPEPPDPADRWLAGIYGPLGGRYRDYLRVYVPDGAVLGSITTSGFPAPMPPYPDDSGTTDGMRWLAYPFELAPGARGTITVDYFLPGPPPGQVTWVKQTGALDWPVSVSRSGGGRPAGVRRALLSRDLTLPLGIPVR